MFKRLYASIVVLAGLVVFLAASPSPALSARVIDNRDTVVLHGNVHPLARPQYDRGETEQSLRMERMILTLRLSSEKRSELETFLTDLHDPTSPIFHHWLSPMEFGQRFGPPQEDVDAVTGWLKSNGFAVDEVANGRLWINFSGSVGDVEKTFQTKIHNYYIGGQLHHANAVSPSIPRGLSDLVAGIVSLNDFPRKAMNTGAMEVRPDYTSGSTHYLSPGDFAVIYNVQALYGAGIDGSGQSIAIVGRTNPKSAASDWAAFRSTMGLSANAPEILLNGTDPGDLGGNEDMEADLDVEWSGAVAENASILFVVSKSTRSTDGVDLSAQYIVDNDLAPVMSTSFGECESDLGSAENSFYSNLWQQAAAQGITAFVASGDAGAAGCNSGSDSTGSGQGVNGLASTIYNVAVGGSQFNEGTGTYWNTSNAAGDVSAVSWIPEAAWNQSGSVSGGSYLWASGGGVSTIYSKPSWQTAPGVPSGNYRCVPDVALSAATHDAYLVEMQGSLYAVGGTSASSPSFAGLMALVVQKTGQRQGNANILLYQIGNAQYGSGGPSIFHDVSSGNNTVPGVTGYSCTTGYDAVTGLGSVDANALVAEMYLRSTPFTLAVTETGTGGGTVVSNPSGINCGSSCSASFNGRTVVTLTSTPNSGSAFSGWSGACTGTALTCQVTVTGAAAVTAGFTAISLPGSPTGVTATAGDHQATVSFTAPASNGGSPITFYTVTAYLANGTVAATATGTASPITVTGLTDGVVYYFTVTATNAAGTGSASADSNDVVPNPVVPVPALGPLGLLITALVLACLFGFQRKIGHG